MWLAEFTALKGNQRSLKSRTENEANSFVKGRLICGCSIKVSSVD